MNHDALTTLLNEVALGQTSVAQATVRLANLPYEDLGFARLDHHRELRQGTAEVIFGAGKTPEQVAQIALHLANHGAPVLCTRATPEAFAATQAVLKDAAYHPLARAITVVRERRPRYGRVGVLSAGTSDLAVAEEAALTVDFFGAEVVRLADVGVAGIHRLLSEGDALKSLDVAIVVAGMEGALPSVVGGLVSIPVVAVPTSVGYGASFGGLAALLGMLNSCAAGITVVNIDNGFGAAAAAQRILSLARR